jgi:UDP-glucose 4-epimerase
MKVLLTGPFGNIGTTTLENLLQQGHQVRCFDYKTSENEEKANRYEGRIETIWGDVRKPEDLAAAVRDRDVVIHLAFIIPITSEVDPERSQQVNVEGTRNLLNAIKKASPTPRVLFASSTTVFGPTQDQPPPRKASDPVNPTLHYTRHKVECEQMVMESGLDWIILRFAAVTPVLFKFNPTMFYLSPDSRMEFAHFRDVGLAVANAVSCDEAWGKTLLIGGGPGSQMYYRDYIGRSMETVGVGRLPDDAFGTIPSSLDWIDTTESQRLLNYQQHSFEDWLAERAALLGYKRYMIRVLRPIYRRRMLRQSPFYKTKGADQ